MLSKYYYLKPGSTLTLHQATEPCSCGKRYWDVSCNSVTKAGQEIKSWSMVCAYCKAIYPPYPQQPQIADVKIDVETTRELLLMEYESTNSKDIRLEIMSLLLGQG